MKIAAFVDRLGPYHCARYRALGRQVDLSVFEFFEKDEVYLWGRQADSPEFQRACLFPRAGPSECRFDKTAAIIGKIFWSERFDAALVPGWSSARALATLREALKAGVPAVLMSESTAHDRARFGVVESVKALIVRLFSAALVGGNEHARYLEALGMPKENIAFGYDAVDNEHFRSAPEAMPEDLLQLGRGYFFCCARFVPEKNLARLIKAYDIYRRRVGGSGHLLVLAGDGPELGELRSLVESLGLVSEVVFVGFRDYRELPAFYQRAEWFVLPSTSEPWGLVVNEALASGLPVLVSVRCGCATELVREGHNGWTFDPYSVGSIADVLVRAHLSSDQKVQMRLHSLDAVEQYGPEAFATGAMKAVELARSRNLAPLTIFDKVVLATAAYR